MTGAPSSCRACGIHSDDVRLGSHSSSLSSLWSMPTIASRDPVRKQRRTISLLQRRPWTVLRSLLLAVCFSIIFCSRAVRAIDTDADELLVSERSPLHFDDGDPPVPPMRLNHMMRRGRGRKTLPASIPAPTTTLTHHGNSASTTSTTTATTGIVTATGAPTTLPRPFDGALGSNFTSPSCPAFFDRFLHNQQFIDCLPFSLLLQTSNSFFAESRDSALLTRTLTATCNVNFPQCSSLMSSLATEIQYTAACGADLSLQNPVVEQAYAGFSAYDPLYHAGCLKSSTPTSSSSDGITTDTSIPPPNVSTPTTSTSSPSPTSTSTTSSQPFCFVEASTNTSAPTSPYVYYLPLGLSMPGGTMPTCDKCLQETMGIFRAYADTGKNALLSVDYPAAAQLVDMVCGPDFVGESVASTSGAAARGSSGDLSLAGGRVSIAGLVGLVVMVLLL